MEWTFSGPVVEWRGPSPYLFVAIPEDDSDDIREAARDVVYWGQVPVIATIGRTEFTTALFPKDGRDCTRRRGGLTSHPPCRPARPPLGL
jgi:hypothetical protein